MAPGSNTVRYKPEARMKIKTTTSLSYFAVLPCLQDVSRGLKALASAICTSWESVIAQGVVRP